MRSIAILAVSLFLLSLSACSSMGKGSGEGHGVDGMGDGNIPLAGAGGELADVNFDYDSSSLSSSAQDILQQNSSWLLNNADQKVVIEGHCDERGTAEYNLALGERRAQSVQSYLQSLGVSPEQLSTVTYGEELPLDTSGTSEAFNRNRRAHFALRK